MKHACFVCLFLCLTTTFLLSQSNPIPLINQSTSVVAPISASQPDPKAQAKILNDYGKLPLSFEANHGQTDGRVKFLSRTGGYTLFLTGDEAVLTLSAKKTSTNKPKIAGAAHTPPSGMTEHKAGGVLRMKLRNANLAAKVTGVDELAGTSNYFIGNDPAKWRTNVPTYAKVKYEGIYSGIDLVYYGNQRQLEYDFIVAAGADPHRIQFDVRGAKRIRRDSHGDLVLKMGDDEIRWHKPVVYQEKNGTRQEIAARYAITDTNRVGFELAKYDASRPLYIDPLIYSTYLGGSYGDQGYGIAVDSAGNAYVTGLTYSSDFPITAGAFQSVCNGGSGCGTYGDAFVTKINADGSAMVYSTFLGGSDYDFGQSIAVDSAGNAYVTGLTYSSDFPITAGAFQSVCNGGSGCGTYGDAFVTKINASGSDLMYSTYLGGTALDQGDGIAVDSAGNAYVTGGTQSTDFPTMNPLQPANAGGFDAFVAKLTPTGSALVYSTYLGGSGNDLGFGIAVDSADNAYVTGYTASTNFPTANPLQPSYGGGPSDAFVAKVTPTGSALVYSTYLGGSINDEGFGIAVDSVGNAYVTGYTTSTNFPTVNPLQPTYGGDYDAFVSEINAAGSVLVYSTYLGGSSQDYGRSITVDSAGNAYVTGNTNSTNFPTMNPLQPTYGGGNSDAFVTKLNPSGSSLVYSTYFGGSLADFGFGIAVDSSGYAYVTGDTNSTNFPTMNPLQPTYGGGNSDAFVSKIGSSLNSATTIATSSNPSFFEESVIFTATVTSQDSGTPTGTVTFTYGSTMLCNAVTLSGGTATCTYSALPVGSDIVTATYSGDSNFVGSSGSLNQTVNQASTTLMLTSNLNPSGLDSPVTFTATITPQYGGQPTGTVTFKDGATTLGSVGVSGNAASLTTTSLAMGTHSIIAFYSGDSNFTGSTSNTVSQVVTKATTTTTLLSSLNPSVQGKSVTFTATVSSLAGTPTGKIEFLNGKAVLTTVKLTSGSAKYTTTKLPPGSYSITAVYEGDANNNGSTSAPVDQFVLASTTTTLKSSPNPSTLGEEVSFTAVVKSSIGAPPNGETVSFVKGTTVLGTGSLSGGTASFTTSTLKVGTNSIHAVYGGDSNFAGSKSNVVEQVVEK
jgi:Big-like domain-containing protein/beta-propeller repeat-containing protein